MGPKAIAELERVCGDKLGPLEHAVSPALAIRCIERDDPSDDRDRELALAQRAQVTGAIVVVDFTDANRIHVKGS